MIFGLPFLCFGNTSYMKGEYMRAFVLTEPKKVKIIDMPMPVLYDDYSAILQPVSMSVCTSDVNTVYGSGSKKPDNLILGHECVARVYEIGNKVRDFSVGDIVVVPSMTPDWREVAVQEGNVLHAGVNFSANALGRSIQGVFAQYFMVKDADTTIAKVPKNVSISSALMCADMVTTGFTGAESADIRFGDRVAVFGIGGVGLMAIAGARLRGASRIIAIGSREVSVRLAREYGATDILDYHDDNFKENIFKLTSGIGVDAALVCGGTDRSFSDAIDVTRYGIGRIVNLNLYKGDGAIEIPKFSSGRGMGGKTISMELGKGGRKRMERLMDMISFGRIDPSLLITHKLYGFDKIETALEMMRQKGDDIIKIEVIPEWS